MIAPAAAGCKRLLGRVGSTCTGDMLGAKTRARNARMGLSPFAVARREPCLGDQSRRVALSIHAESRTGTIP